jgi:hypothetical protein
MAIQCIGSLELNLFPSLRQTFTSLRLRYMYVIGGLFNCGQRGTNNLGNSLKGGYHGEHHMV